MTLHYEDSSSELDDSRNIGGVYVNVFEHFQGLFFLWPATIVIRFFSVAILLPLNAALFDCPIIYVLGVAAIILTYQSSMWNCIHPMIHLEPTRLGFDQGMNLLQSPWIQGTWIYGWLWKNHVLHHLIVGKKRGNYNVILPGADFVFGTYHRNSDRYEIGRRRFEVVEPP